MSHKNISSKDTLLGRRPTNRIAHIDLKAENLLAVKLRLHDEIFW